jgi:RNA polymerase sigma-70 factor (ECF subfamily)
VPAGGEELEQAAEAALLRAGRAGDEAALEQLLARHKRPLSALCHGILAHPDDVEDAVQETFLRALRALPGFRGDAAFRTWLFRIAVNVCLKGKAARRPTEPWHEGEPRGAQPSSSAEALALRHLQIQDALRALTPRGRAMLLLREVEGWSVVEIGAAMGRSRKQVENELYRVRCALAEWRRQDDDQGGE